jgi:hypothetical protein
VPKRKETYSYNKQDLEKKIKKEIQTFRLNKAQLMILYSG